MPIGIVVRAGEPPAETVKGGEAHRESLL